MMLMMRKITGNEPGFILGHHEEEKKKKEKSAEES